MADQFLRRLLLRVSASVLLGASCGGGSSTGPSTNGPDALSLTYEIRVITFNPSTACASPSTDCSVAPSISVIAFVQANGPEGVSYQITNDAPFIGASTGKCADSGTFSSAGEPVYCDVGGTTQPGTFSWQLSISTKNSTISKTVSVRVG
jgi:hypothetical protein